MTSLPPHATPRSGRAARGIALVAGLAGVTLLALFLVPRVGRSSAVAHQTGMGAMVMTDWFATHRKVGVNSIQTPAATFTVQNYNFDADANVATQIDTVRIGVGQAVLWQWVNGVHTITNGTGSADPNAGTLFDQASGSTATQFTYVFNTVGTYPFFCRYHEFSNMKGAVIVQNTTPTIPKTWGSVKSQYAH